MKLAALYSGGKDSTLALYLMEQMGHEVPYLVNIVPKDPHSFLFHTPNLHLMPAMAGCMAKELISVPGGVDEESDLRALRSGLEGLDAEGVITGALASDYQWDRINRICDELGLRVFSPLWRKDPLIVMSELLDSGVKAIIVGVAAEGLGQEWLGRPIDRQALDDLQRLSARYGLNIAGEGGEYETLILDSPLHHCRIEPDSCLIEMQQLSGTLRVESFRTVSKECP